MRNGKLSLAKNFYSLEHRNFQVPVRIQTYRQTGEKFRLLWFLDWQVLLCNQSVNLTQT
jgi:hypothetical protein